jgi:hypothetical protein
MGYVRNEEGSMRRVTMAAVLVAALAVAAGCGNKADTGEED